MDRTPLAEALAESTARAYQAHRDLRAIAQFFYRLEEFGYDGADFENGDLADHLRNVSNWLEQELDELERRRQDAPSVLEPIYDVLKRHGMYYYMSAEDAPKIAEWLNEKLSDYAELQRLLREAGIYK